MFTGRMNWRAVGLSALVAFAAGCSGGGQGIGNIHCETTEDCAEGFICEDGLCVVEVDPGDDPDTDTDTTPPADTRADYTEECATSSDCKPGLECVTTEHNGRICTRRCPMVDAPADACDDDNARFDMECLTVRPDGGDAIALCLPRPPTYCTSCEREGDDITGSCGTVGVDLCLPQDDGFFCAVDCSGGKSCPDGAECRSVLEGEHEYEVCVPTEGRCIDCIDQDGDGYGIDGYNSECPHPDLSDCNDSDSTVYPGASDVCDGRDTSCMGRPDYEFTTEEGVYHTISHCGACDNNCYGDNVAAADCEVLEGVASCVILACEEGTADCDGDPSNGCEAQLNTPETCGACDVACGGDSTSTTVAQCIPSFEGSERFLCEIECADGFADCDDDSSNGCEADLDSAGACGYCGNNCDDGRYPNATGVCTGGGCELGTCEEGFADCDGDPSNGCEADLSDESSCGACGVVCGSQNTVLPSECIAGATAEQNSCRVLCQHPFTDCNGIPNDGCEVNTNLDANNCGSCGQSCDYANSNAGCLGGFCSFDGCHDGFADCDADMGVHGSLFHPLSPKSGCEQNLTNNDQHCGTCGNDCTAMAGEWVCDVDDCFATTCPTGQLDCDGSGTCSQSAHDPTTCGGCSTNCLTAPHVDSADCNPNSVNRCTITGCDAGYADCNGNAADGCEVNTDTNVNSCGTCGNKCELPNSVMECSNGTCLFVECLPGWMNLDGNEHSVGCDYQCTPSSGEDRPGDFSVAGYNWQHHDTNCDGIDGDINAAIFVDGVNGNDTNAGTMSAPLKSINAALLDATAPSAKKQIYVSEGIYDENVLLVAGVAIYGGFKASDGWKRSPSYVTTINANSADANGDIIAVSGNNLTSTTNRTILQNLSITAGSNVSLVPGTLQGASSYGIHCTNCSGLEVRGSIVRANNGAAGRTPDRETEPGQAGVKGGSGTAGDEDGSRRGQGGPGATGSCTLGSAGYSGGAGGQGGERGDNRGVTGLQGFERISSGGGGAGGQGGQGGGGAFGSAAGQPGDPGNTGATGSIGSAGDPGLIAHTLVGGRWRGDPGSAGGVGTPGHGGGGGGGGGGQGGAWWNNGSGNGGGGGGSGGCGGAGGAGGGAGGGSFAMFLTNSSSAVIRNSTLRSGNGGAGPVGAEGQDGGPGGEPGNGMIHKPGEIGRGGNGGAGGVGGKGGTGGRGAGGPSISLYSRGMTTGQINQIIAPSAGNTLNHGSGGAGGTTGIAAPTLNP